MLNPTETLQAIIKWGGQSWHSGYHRSPTMASAWHIIAGHLSDCASVCPSNQITPEAPAAKSQLLQGCVMGLILTRMNGSQVECQLKWSHCRSNCDGLCDFKHRSVGVYFCMCVWMWKVNTVSRSAALRTLSLFSSQRSVWKAYCCMNLGVAEWAVSPPQTPSPLLNLQVRTLSCTMVSREHLVSCFQRVFLSRLLREAAAECCAETEWQSELQKVSIYAV